MFALSVYITIYLALPVTKCSGERSFSNLKCITNTLGYIMMMMNTTISMAP